MEERIEEILRSFSDLSNRYSLTIYQIAIEFAQRYETDFLKMSADLMLGVEFPRRPAVGRQDRPFWSGTSSRSTR